MPARRFALMIAYVILAAGLTVGIASYAGLVGAGLVGAGLVGAGPVGAGLGLAVLAVALLARLLA